jgi:hypothetical protein
MNQAARDHIDAIARHELNVELGLHHSKLGDIGSESPSAVVAEFDRHMDRVHDVMHDALRRHAVH